MLIRKILKRWNDFYISLFIDLIDLSGTRANEFFIALIWFPRTRIKLEVLPSLWWGCKFKNESFN